MAQHRVKVWDRDYVVTTEQVSKAVCRAVGEYQGETIYVQDRSAGSALKRWIDAARYKGN